MKYLLKLSSVATVAAALMITPSRAFQQVYENGSGVVDSLGIDSFSISHNFTIHDWATYDCDTFYTVDSSSWVYFKWGTSADVDLVIWVTVSSYGYMWNSEGGDVIYRTFTGPDYLSFPGSADPTVNDDISYTVSPGVTIAQLTATIDLRVDCTDFYWGPGWGEVGAASDNNVSFYI